jgi:hypothetical protein
VRSRAALPRKLIVGGRSGGWLDVGTSPAASAAEPRAGEANPQPMVTLTVGFPVRILVDEVK